MSNYALYTPDKQTLPAGVADALLKRTADNSGWEFKTAAQLGIASRLYQTQFVEQTIDTSTGSATFGPLLSQAITTTAGSYLLITTTVSLSNTANANNDIQITIDGAAVRGATIRSNVGTGGSAAITYRKSGLSAGAHTIAVQWRTSSGSARIRPATQVMEHASLSIIETAV